jgi:3-oxoacyl-[acyl-carrier-protein] synthase II
MTTHRVVVTGVGIASPIGASLPEVSQSLQTGRHGIVTVPEWDGVGELRTRLAGVVPGYRSPPADGLLKPNAATSEPKAGPGLPYLDLEGRWHRKKTRTMGRVGLLATYATEQALAMAGLQDDPVLGSGAAGLAYGSTSGSSEALVDFCVTLFTRLSMRGLQSTSFLKFMAHTCAANLAQFFGVRGRIVPVNSACTSGAQAIGYAYEAIKHGKQDVMIAGGADEMHFTTAVTFDLMFATSANYNARPDLSPRPFDAKRDGLVVGEGAGTLILESYERAKARGAKILGELVGYGTNCDGIHITAPSETGMCGAMALSLHDARPTSTTSTPTGPRPTSATSPRPARRGRCSAARSRSPRRSRSPATRWAPAARSRPPSAWRCCRTSSSRRRATSRRSTRAAPTSTTSARSAASPRTRS